MTTADGVIDEARSPKLIDWVLPLPLIVVPLLWILAFYLRVDDLQITYLATLGVRGGLTLFFLALALFLVISEKGGGPARVTLLWVLGFFTACFSFAAGVHGMIPMITKTIGQFVLSALPALVLGVYCAKNKSGDDLLRGLEKWGVVFLPAAIFYVWRFFGFSGEIHTLGLSRLGRIDYMSLAYGFIPLMAASCVLLFDDKAPRRWFMGRWLLVCSYWLAIIFTQTRGAVLGGALFLVAIVVVEFGRYKGRALVLFFLCSVLFVISMVVIPRLFGETSNRFSSVYIDEAISFSGGAVTGTEITNGREFLLSNENNGVLIDTENNLCTIHNKEIARQIALDDGIYELVKESGCTIKLSRMSLLEISIQEVRKAPWLGMGPLAYPLRYFGFHPHNLLIELLAEFGVVLGGIIIGRLLFIAYVFLFRGKRQASDQKVLLLAMIHAPMFMVSGTVWADAPFSFLLGYLFVFAWEASSKGAKFSPKALNVA